ncbi:MAG: T9SS type A sorting domain-containing protein [Ignavibacteriales bacterium]|nr:T9SS type A sorting domain-containing protein [Ignavibacteriales bacterium]MCF8306958.1 T9SS type A sorting domain-containing protein [Ignavibacteriales bacterium]MCF8437398.1 T9SS type A sorting domain-containing protein [Ignavibacteriales bacterium]
MYKIFFALVIMSTLSFSQSLQILSSPDFKETMRDIAFVDASTGWMVGNNGTIYFTSDGGHQWSEQISGITNDIVKVFFVDALKGWCSTLDGIILKTTNGGASWSEYSYRSAIPHVTLSLCDVLKFFDQNTGFIITGKLKQSYLLKTIDGGVTWVKKDSLVGTTNRRWYDIDFSGNSGVIVGDKKDIEKYSSDLGETWTYSAPIADNFFRDLKYVKFLSPTDIIAIGEGNEFSGVIVPAYKSADGGATWVKKNQSFAGVYDRVKDAYFKDAVNGVGIGSDGFSKAFVVHTTDGGETWTNKIEDFAFGLQNITGIDDDLVALGTSTHLISSSDFGDSWELLPFKSPSSINAMCMTESKGYAVTRNGDLYASEDARGNTWNYYSSTGRNNAGAMTFINENTGFVLKENHHIVKTTDGGVSWQTVLDPVNPGSRNLVGGISFGDPNNGYAWFSQNDYGEYHVYKTTDAGETWSETASFAGPGYISGNIIAFDALTAVILGPDLWTQRTADGGSTWNPVSLNNFPAEFSTKDFEGAALINENTAMAIGDKFICITTDKGGEWTYLDHGISDIDSSFYTIAFSSDTLGYIGQFDGTILKTTDLGTTWSADTTFRGEHYLYASAISPTGKAFFGTSVGYIIGEPTIVKMDDHNLIQGFSLKQNYPNPFNPSTVIEFQLPYSVHAVLKVFDILGNEVSVLLDNEVKAGMHRITFDASKGLNNKLLSSGIYFYRLQAGDYVSVQKMLLMK